MTENRINTFFIEKQNYERILGLCFSISKRWEDAEDATHNTFLALRKVDQASLPVDETELLRYVQTAARNCCYEMLRKNVKQENLVKENTTDPLNDWLNYRKSSVIQKLDKLDELIKNRKDLFTTDQLKLWDCMYQCMPVIEIEKALGKDKQTIYSLRNKLREKIRKNFCLADLEN